MQFKVIEDMHNIDYVALCRSKPCFSATQTTAATIVTKTAAHTAAGQNNLPIMATEVRVAKIPTAGVKTL